MNDRADIYVVLPAYNEGQRLGAVIRQALELGYDKLVVVDDGSDDHTAGQARELGAVVLRHKVNLGAGAATQTGVSWCVQQGASVIVTMDADAQHDPQDIQAMVDLLEEGGYDMVIGSRFLNVKNRIPFSRVWYNKFANLISWLFTGMWVSDSQSGMKALRGEFAGSFELNWDGFEFCIEQLRFARILNAKVAEVPIRVYYDRETIKKGQNLATGVRTLGKIIKRHS